LRPLEVLYTMDSGDFSLTCVCARSFAQPGGLAYHCRSCKKAKVRLAGALRMAKDAWTDRKRRRCEDTEAGRESLSQQNVGPSKNATDTRGTNVMDVEVRILPFPGCRLSCLTIIVSPSVNLEMRQKAIHLNLVRSLTPLRYLFLC